MKSAPSDTKALPTRTHGTAHEIPRRNQGARQTSRQLMAERPVDRLRHLATSASRSSPLTTEFPAQICPELRGVVY
jgi:hypothetical protein